MAKHNLSLGSRRVPRCPHCNSFIRLTGFNSNGDPILVCDSCGWENRTGTYTPVREDANNWATTPNENATHSDI